MSSPVTPLIIDAQESFRHRSYFREEETNEYLERQQALIDGVKAAAIPVIQIFHVASEGVFSEASGYVTPAIHPACSKSIRE